MPVIELFFVGLVAENDGLGFVAYSAAVFLDSLLPDGRERRLV